VEYIEIVDLISVLSQYTLTLDIVYKHAVRPSITQVSGRNQLEETVRAALRDRRSLLTVEMPYFNAQEHSVEDMVNEYYYSNPAWAMEYPGVTVSLYPASGNTLRRIVELELSWQSSGDVLRRKTRETENSARLLRAHMPGFSGDAEETDAQTVLWLHDSLCRIVMYDSEGSAQAQETQERRGGDPYTAYGALVNNLAVSEGYAMAFKLLCDELDISSLVVSGQWMGDEHSWNLVRIGSAWYHIGVAFNDSGDEPIYDFFLLDDETAHAETFRWERGSYPASSGGLWTLESISGLTAEDNGE
jgi:hypothetical protein